MSNNKQKKLHGTYQALRVLCVVLSVSMGLAGCGGGGSAATGTASTTPTSSSTSATTDANGKPVLTADAGPICETQLPGATYTIPIPTLSCNGAGPNIAKLDGRKSSASDGSALTYSWSFVSVPKGSTVTLQGANTATPTFVPDIAGPYRVQLVVSAKGINSPRAVGQVDVLDNATLTTFYKFHGGLSSNCAACHTNSYPVLPDKPSTHIASSNMCQACHTPAGFAKIGFVDHKEVVGILPDGTQVCSNCHDGVTATGKSNLHIPTTQECGFCHKSTTHFVPLADGAVFDHSTTTEPCSACHNGTIATGISSDPNPSGHPTVTVECNACHTTVSFANAFPNHNDARVVVPGTCGQSGCHDGSSFLGSTQIKAENSAPNQPHVDTGSSEACDLCHNTTSFNMGGVFSHSVLGQLPADGINLTCVSCHDGKNATGAPDPSTGHTTDTNCALCHSTTVFKPALTVPHDTFTAATDCAASGCHDGTVSTATGMPTDAVHNASTVGSDFGSQASDPTHYCGQCHTPPGGSFHTATVDHTKTVFGSLGVTATATCVTCHDGSIPTANPKTSNHIASANTCEDCHSPQGVSFAGALYDHSGLTVTMGTPSTSTPDACSSCHDGTVATGQSLAHVPVTAASGTDCVVCHYKGPGFASSVSDFSTFKMDTFDHATAGISKNCTSCHNGKTYDTTLVINKPLTHIPTSGADCSTCHNDTTNGPTVNGTSNSGFSTAILFTTPTTGVHDKYTTGCRSCHNGNYASAPYNAPGHPTDPNDPVTGSFVALHVDADNKGWECNACHSTSGKFLDGSVNHQDPTQMAPGCYSCHQDNQTSSPLGRLSGHIGYGTTNDTDCKQCHQPGGSFAAYDHSLLTITGSGNTKTSTPTQCLECHDGVTATGKPQNHVATSRDCISCHTGYPPTVSTYTGTGSFDHATAPEMAGKLCMDCHDGSILGALSKADKTDGHVVTSADCGACHTTDAFKPATTFDHTGVTSGCQASGCHAANTAGVVDVTDDPNTYAHIPISNGGTEVDCINCHTNPGGTFANAIMDHTVVTFKNCEDCHGGSPNYDGANTAHKVTVQSSSHIKKSSTSTFNTIATITTCATCHTSTSDWTQVKYSHRSKSASPPGYYPGDHNTGRVSTCTQCHNDSPPTYQISSFDNPVGRNNVSRPQYYGYCAGCHGAKGEGEHGAPLSSSHYDCTGSNCHRVSSSSF